jgi:hypothetical protein
VIEFVVVVVHKDVLIVSNEGKSFLNLPFLDPVSHFVHFCTTMATYLAL